MENKKLMAVLLMAVMAVIGVILVWHTINSAPGRKEAVAICGKNK